MLEFSVCNLSCTCPVFYRELVGVTCGVLVGCLSGTCRVLVGSAKLGSSRKFHVKIRKCDDDTMLIYSVVCIEFS